MLEDATCKTLFANNNYAISLNTKFQVSIKNVTPQPEALALEETTA
jgi:hypothetical protein